MLLTKIRGSRQDLRRLDHSPIFLQRRGVRRIEEDRFEVSAVMNETEAALLTVKGYEVIVKADARTLLAERLRSAAAPPAAVNPPEATFQSVTTIGGYMTVDYMNAWIANLPDVFATMATTIPLPNQTWEGRSSYAVRLRAGGEDARRAVLLMSGVHAAEMVGPDAAIYLLYRLLSAYRGNTPVVMGNLTVDAATVHAILNSLDVYVLPCVNPDGRQFVMQTRDWWRKNRNPHVGVNAVGVDINRNFDFLWWSGLGSSALPHDETYRGPAPFSEPETRNVQWLLEKSGAGYFMDVHGPAGTLLYTWGDAQDQSANPDMNFLNPAWDGRRTVPYGEYLHAADNAAIARLGTAVVAAANSTAGGYYELKQSFGGIYPTSATSDDYAYSRHIADTTQRKAYSFTFEYSGGDYFPPYDQMLGTRDEVNAAMLGLCAAALA
jgi:murein tripeptide amidase MpaA